MYFIMSSKLNPWQLHVLDIAHKDEYAVPFAAASSVSKLLIAGRYFSNETIIYLLDIKKSTAEIGHTIIDFTLGDTEMSHTCIK